jgi:hypothetical protein
VVKKKMHNEKNTTDSEQVSQDQVEALLELAHSGLSPEDISLAISINIETVRLIITNDLMQGGDRLNRLKQVNALLGEGALQSHKPEAEDQCLISLRAKVEALTEVLVKGQGASQNQIAQDLRIQRLEEQAADCQETLSSLKANAKALTEELVKAREEIIQVKTAQDAQTQRLDEFHKAETATQQTLNILRAYLNQALSQCKQDQESMLQRLGEQSQKTETNALKLSSDLAETKQDLQDTRQALYHLHEVTLPTFIYSYMPYTDELYRTNLVTGEQSSHRVRSYRFKYGCCLSEVPGGGLLITGGMNGLDAVKEAVRIDVGTFEVSPQRDMHTPRGFHAAVCHTQHLYILGGRNYRYSSKCERYVWAKNRWESLRSLPRACSNTSGVVVERSLYALGGYADGSYLDLVQRLSLENFTWELMQMRLPYGDFNIPCFKLRNTEVYLVVKQTLCLFTGLEVRPLKTLSKVISNFGGASYYRRGTLYCSYYEGAVHRHDVGSLSN